MRTTRVSSSCGVGLLMVEIEEVPVQILYGVRNPQGFFFSGSTMFAPDDFSSWYDASISTANYRAQFVD
jgi:hypothetical protein